MASPRVAVGTYTGVRPNSNDNDVQRVALPFTPDLVVVVPESADYPGFKTRTSWYGKTMFFETLSSALLIGPYVGQLYMPFNGRGFSVRDDFNQAGTTYHYLAICDNGSGMYANTSWIGNATAGRQIVLGDGSASFDAAWVKRDAGTLASNDRPAIFRAAGSANATFGTFQGEGDDEITSISATGLVVDNSVQTNENAGGSSLGEGIEACAFRNYSDICSVTRYTGNDAISRNIDVGLAADFAIVIDEANDSNAAAQHGFITSNMSADEFKTFGNAALDTSGDLKRILGDNVQVGQDFNLQDRAYYIIAFRHTGGAESPETVVGGLKKRRLAAGTDRVVLPDNSIGTGASAIKFWAQMPIYDDDNFQPCLMLGDGGSGDADAYNGGLYGQKHDPAGNDWYGLVWRAIQYQEFLPLLSDGGNNINHYNIHSGVPYLPGANAHVVIAHDGEDNFFIYVDGVRVKAFEPTNGQLDGRDGGGTGGALDTVIAALKDGTFSDMDGPDLYGVEIWESDTLTPAQVRSKYRADLFGETYDGPTPTTTADWTQTGTVAIATETGGSVLDRIVEPAHPTDTLIIKSVLSTIGSIGDYTWSNFFESAGRYMVMLQSVANGSHSVDTITGDGEACTALGEETGTTTIDTGLYFIETDSAGDLFVDWTANVVYAVATLIDATNLDELATIYKSSSATAVDPVVTLSGVPTNHRIFSCAGRSGYANETLRNAQQEWRAWFGAAWLDTWLNVGSTSLFSAGSGISRGQASLSIRHESPTSTKRLLTAFAVADSALAQTTAISSPTSESGGLRYRGRFSGTRGRARLRSQLRGDG